MKHLLGCVVALAVLAAECYSKGDYDHWRWWFLASTTDSATIALYDKIEDKYLHVSDLRVLREDLEPLYVQLSQSISNESEAQTAALLIRLFHYSAARPYKTAYLSGQVSQRLMEYILDQNPVDFDVQLWMDMWTACDLGVNAGDPASWVHEVGLSRLLPDVITSAFARISVTDMQASERYRILLQTVDAITKELEFGMVSDTSYSGAVLTNLYSLMDSISVYARRFDNRWEWRFLGRIRDVLQIRLFRYSETAIYAEQIAAAVMVDSALNRVCFPEVRLRAAIQSFLEVKGSSEHATFVLSQSDDPFKKLLIHEHAVVGSSQSLRQTSILRAYITDRAVRFSGVDSSYWDEFSRRVQRAIEEYSSCYDAIYPPLLLQGQEYTREFGCALSKVMDDLTTDSHLPLRRAMVYLAFGDTLKCMAALDELIALSRKKFFRREAMWRVVDLIIANKLVVKNDAGFGFDQNLVHAMLAITEDYYQMLLIGASEAATVPSLNAVRNTVCALETLLELNDQHTGYALAEGGYRIVRNLTFADMHREQARASSTMISRARLNSARARSKIDLSNHGDSLQPAQSVLRRWNESMPLASIVHGDGKLDMSVLTYLGQIGELLGLVAHERRVAAAEVEKDTYPWNPKSDRMYLIAERSPKFHDLLLSRLTDEFDGEQIWRFKLVWADSVMVVLNVEDWRITQSVSRKQHALMYGLNTETFLDTLIYKMVSSLGPRTESRVNTLVFVPSELLFSFNPYLITYAGNSLVNQFDIAVATRLHSNSEASVRRDGICTMLNPLGDELDGVSVEHDSMLKAFKKRDKSLVVLDKVRNELELAECLKQTEILHVNSHAIQGSLESSARDQSEVIELQGKTNIGVIARLIWSPLVQYSATTNNAEVMYGDGYLSPIEYDLYEIHAPKLVYLSACRTVTSTSDKWEPPDGFLRMLFTRGTDCIVSSPIPVADKYAPDYSGQFYEGYLDGLPPHQCASKIVRNGIVHMKNPLSYGAYYPIYFETE